MNLAFAPATLELVESTPDVRRRRRPAVRGRPGRCRPVRRFVAGGAAGRRGRTGVFAPHVPTEWGGLGLDHARPGGGVRGGGLPLARAAGAQLRRAGRGQHAPARGGRHAEQQRALPAAAGRGRGPLLLRDDRAGAGRGLGPGGAARPRRRGSTAAGGSTAASGSSPAPTAPAFAICMARTDGAPASRRRHDVPGRRRQPRLCSVERTIDDARQRSSRRPQRGALRRLRGAGRTRCSARSARASATPRCGSAPARLTHCMRWLGRGRRAHDIAARLRRRRARRSARSSASSGMVQRMIADNEIDIAASRGARSGSACWVLDQGGRAAQRVLDRQGLRRRGGRPGGRPRGADLRRPRRLRRPAARADLPRGAPVPDLRRAVRGAPLGASPSGLRQGRARRGAGRCDQPCRPRPRRACDGSSPAASRSRVSLRAELRSAAGRSNLTYADHRRRGSAWVLRRPRSAGLHAVGARHGPGVPGAWRRGRARRCRWRPAVARCDDAAVLGAPFTVVGCRRRAGDPHGDELRRPGRRRGAAHYAALVEVLGAAARGRVRGRRAGRLRPAGGYLARQVRRWTSAVGAGRRPRTCPTWTACTTGLAGRLPRGCHPGTRAIVHGDYRIDNTILAAAGGGRSVGPEVARGRGLGAVDAG